MVGAGVDHISDSDSDGIVPARRSVQSHMPASSRARRPISPPALSRQAAVAASRPVNSPPASIHAASSIQAHGNSPQSAKSSRDDVKFTALPGKQGGSSAPVNMTSPSHNAVAGQKTPKAQTPRKIDWTSEKVEERLRNFSHEIGRDGARTSLRLVRMQWKQLPPKLPTDHKSKTDWFASMKRLPVEGGVKSSDTMRIKTKQGGQQRSGKQEKKEYYKVICIKTDLEPVPSYSFHHIDIVKNILSPNTMLTYVPHLKDLADNEEVKYRRWLENLENMDKTSGFATLSRHQKVAKTMQKERAATLLLYLDRWLHRLGLENCNRSSLILYIANQSDAVTPQQKTSIINSYNPDPCSPRSDKSVRMFADAFDRVFNSDDQGDHAVTLDEVLKLDKSLDTIVDPKRWVKDTPSQPKADEPETVESFVETYAVLGCLVCYSHSCEHGEYGVDNYRKRFSIETVGGLSTLLQGQEAPRLAETEQGSPVCRKARTPCGEECFLNGRPGTRAKSWSPIETMTLKSVFTTFHGTSIPVQCTVALMTKRPCWDVSRQLDKLNLTPPSSIAPAPAVKVKPLQWYDRHKKMLFAGWEEHTVTHEHQRKDHFDPCNHEGPCTEENCDCAAHGLLCERFCRCTAATCARKFTGCACHSQGKTCMSKQKDRPCICVQLNRECDPVLCGSCGASERSKPANGDNAALLATGCQNCVLQRGKAKSLMLGKSRVAGYGLYTTEDIAQDEFVIEYVGELISHDEGVRREARRGDVFDESSNTSYLFTLLEQEGTWVDAAIYGNLSRYINHQDSECNVTPRIMYVNSEYRIKFTSLRDIKAGEELFFNYGENFPNLTKKLLQEEKANKKKRTKNNKDDWDDDDEDDKPIKPKRARRKPGPKNRKRPASKAKQKTTVEDSDQEDENTPQPIAEDPFVSSTAHAPLRRRRRGGLDDSEIHNTANSESIQIATSTHPRSRKRRGSDHSEAPSGLSRDNSREAKMETEDEQDEPQTRSRATPKVTPRKTRQALENRSGGLDGGNRDGGPELRSSARRRSITRSGTFDGHHTAAMFAPAPDSDNADEEETPTRIGTRRSLNESSTGAMSRRGRSSSRPSVASRKRSRVEDDQEGLTEYESDGAGLGPPHRKRRKPARYDD